MSQMTYALSQERGTRTSDIRDPVLELGLAPELAPEVIYASSQLEI